MTEPTTIRLDDEIREQAEKKRKAYGLPSLSALIRIAIMQLKVPQE